MCMGYLQLFKRHPIFDFLDPEMISSDFGILKESFELNDVSNIAHLLKKYDKEWNEYLEQLLKVRRLRLFNSEHEIPDEKAKIDEYVRDGNKIAAEMKKILECKNTIPRTWPIPEIGREMQRYAEWKKIGRMEEQAFNYLLYNALKEIYFPRFFFEQRIFKLEEEYKGFKYDFLKFLGPEGLFISYLIHKKQGIEKVFDNLQDFVVHRYIPKRTIGIDAIRLFSLFLWDGNDVNNCNRFLTRRMKEDIYAESEEHTSLTNNINGEYFKVAFREFFYADPSSLVNLRDPFERTVNDPGLIEQAIFNHMIGNYAASVNLLFPLIEGIIWDISVAEHLENRGIYTDDSDLTTRDVRKRTLLGRDGSPIVQSHGYPTLGELLESTKMGNIINTDFVKMLIQEMYPSERNPVLHGVKLDYNEPWQSSRMLLMIEYLLHLIKTRKYIYPEQLDEQGYWTSQKNKERPPSRVTFLE